MVITRYIYREVLGSFIAIVSILLFIAISNKFVMFLAKSAAGKLPAVLVFKVVLLYIPELFSILAPVATFIAILFTYSRLHADSEIVVLLTSGFDWWILTRVALNFAAVIAILVGIINFFVVPHISVYRDQILANGQISGMISSITPGRFQTISDNEHLVFYVENVLSDGQLQNIFIAQQAKENNATTNKSAVVITAKTAKIKQQHNHNEFYLILNDGFRYVGTPGTADYSVTSFVEYGRQFKNTGNALPHNEDIRTTSEILRSKDPVDIAEFQWRIAMPVIVIILALFAIPLSKVQPRQGRYAKFLPAVLIYMIYYNLLAILRKAIANGSFPSWPGIYLLHIIFIFCAIALLLHMSGKLQEWKHKYTS